MQVRRCARRPVWPGGGGTGCADGRPGAAGKLADAVGHGRPSGAGEGQGLAAGPPGRHWLLLQSRSWRWTLLRGLKHLHDDGQHCHTQLLIDCTAVPILHQKLSSKHHIFKLVEGQLPSNKWLHTKSLKGLYIMLGHINSDKHRCNAHLHWSLCGR